MVGASSHIFYMLSPGKDPQTHKKKNSVIPRQGLEKASLGLELGDSEEQAEMKPAGLFFWWFPGCSSGLFPSTCRKWRH